MKLPELQPLQQLEEHPAVLLFSYFATYFQIRGYKTGNHKRRLDVINLPGVQLQSRYLGIDENDLQDRNAWLKLHGEQTVKTRSLPYGTITEHVISEKYGLKQLGLELSPVRKDHMKRLELIRRQIPDTVGCRGVETFSLYIRHLDELFSEEPLTRRADVITDHKYHLPNERHLYNLPQTTGGDRPTPIYPYLGPPEREPTYAFWDRQRLENPRDNAALLQRLGGMLLEDL